LFRDLRGKKKEVGEKITYHGAKIIPTGVLVVQDGDLESSRRAVRGENTSHPKHQLLQTPLQRRQERAYLPILIFLNE
jgi:hypothetical protein